MNAPADAAIASTGTLSPQDVVARIGKLTASRMGDAMSFLASGKGGKAERKQYIRELVLERLNDRVTPHYVTPAMQNGIDRQPFAAIAYMALTGRELIDGHFIDHPTLDAFGATPDYWIMGGGLCEVKCPTAETFMEWKLAKEIPEEHKPQMAAQVLCSGEPFVDFFAWNPEFPKGKQHILHRYVPEPEYLDSVMRHAAAFLKEVDEMFERFVNA